MALDELLAETRKRSVTDIQDMMKAEDAAAAATKKRLEEQQNAANALLTSLRELTDEYKNEEEVNDIPFDTGKIVADEKKKKEDLAKFNEDHPWAEALGFTNEE